ncbi:nicotinamidase-related amidase [Kitasatospora sp. MAP12-15]|nr:nicotinamidase-related amidase [Kitasatospora sp. MAP12-44]
MDPRTTALIVIDVQQGFINAHSAGAVPVIVRMIEAWKSAGAPIVFARFQNLPNSPYERINGWTRLRTPEEQAIVAELQPYLGDAAVVIDKGTSSVFAHDGGRALAKAGWTDLVFAGIDTDSCVYDSAIGAYHSGFCPWIAVDACASSGGEEYHSAALLLARRNIGSTQLITSHDAIARLTSTERAYS